MFEYSSTSRTYLRTNAGLFIKEDFSAFYIQHNEVVGLHRNFDTEVAVYIAKDEKDANEFIDSLISKEG